jgi:hypothetical protein
LFVVEWMRASAYDTPSCRTGSWGDALNEPYPSIIQASARSVTDAPTTPETAPGSAAHEPTAEPAGRTVRIFGRTYPFVAPNIRDPRLHLAAVIISIHFLGQIALGFRVSVPRSGGDPRLRPHEVVTLYKTNTWSGRRARC